MSCEPTPGKVYWPARAGAQAPADEATLVAVGDAPTRTARRACDARTAACRGLAQYLAGLMHLDDAGGQVNFAVVREGFGEPEEDAEFPWAAVWSLTAGRYESGNSPAATSANRIGDSDTHVVKLADLTLELSVEFVAGSAEGRSALMTMLEDELLYPDPGAGVSRELYGVTLALPFYFGQRASYTPVESSYPDDPVDVRRGRFRGAVKVTCTIPVCRLVVRSKARLRASTNVIETAISKDVT